MSMDRLAEDNITRFLNKKVSRRNLLKGALVGAGATLLNASNRVIPNTSTPDTSKESGVEKSSAWGKFQVQEDPHIGLIMGTSVTDWFDSGSFRDAAHKTLGSDCKESGILWILGSEGAVELPLLITPGVDHPQRWCIWRNNQGVLSPVNNNKGNLTFIELGEQTFLNDGVDNVDYKAIGPSVDNSGNIQRFIEFVQTYSGRGWEVVSPWGTSSLKDACAPLSSKDVEKLKSVKFL